MHKVGDAIAVQILVYRIDFAVAIQVLMHEIKYPITAHANRGGVARVAKGEGRGVGHPI